MKIFKKILIILIFYLIILCTIFSPVFAESKKAKIKAVDYTDEYKKWILLSDEEKSKVMEPRKYEVKTANKSRNALFLNQAFGAGENSSYDMRNVIPANLAVRNQMNTNSCWVFAALSSLETNLALYDYNHGLPVKVYDFSERHMVYSSLRDFPNGKINPYGYNWKVSEGGSWAMASAYLTNGMGAIDESSMPFENNENDIDISQIQNKTVTSEVYDTINFPDYQKEETAEGKQKVINSIKNHIKTYGSVWAEIYGNTNDLKELNCYNENTNAEYCNNENIYPPDHSVSIIGWDDNFSSSNFNEGVRPSSNGAWLVRNSWGEYTEVSLTELRQQLFDTYRQDCLDNGWTNPSMIPANKIELSNGKLASSYRIEGDTIYIPTDGNGFFYVSYEDCNISKYLSGIIKAENKKNYKDIYQYDLNGAALKEVQLNDSSFLIYNIFDKKESDDEYITKAAIYIPETSTCKVYVNPNGTDVTPDKLQFIELKDGNSRTVEQGYHTFEFKKPIKITGDKFVVLFEIKSEIERTGENEGGILYVETPYEYNEDYRNTKVTTETEKCFATIGTVDYHASNWIDLGKLKETINISFNGDSTIKAYTVGKEDVDIEPDPEPEQENNANTNYVTIEVNNEVRNEAKNDVKNEVRNDVKNEAKNNVKNEVRNDVKNEAKNNVKNEVKNDVRNEVKNENRNNVKNNTINDDTKKPNSSNFNNAKCEINHISIHTYSNDNEENYIEMNTIISNIKKGTGNDNIKYYYYISLDDTKDPQEITEWTEIKNAISEDDKLEFVINTKDIKNMDKLAEQENQNVYIYIKEISEKDGNKSTVISKALKINENADVDTYIDDEYISKTRQNPNIKTYNGKNEQHENNSRTTYYTNNSNASDSTTAKGVLPYTGQKKAMLIIIAIAAMIGTLIYIKYRKLSKYIK